MEDTYKQGWSDAIQSIRWKYVAINKSQKREIQGLKLRVILLNKKYVKLEQKISELKKKVIINEV